MSEIRRQAANVRDIKEILKFKKKKCFSIQITYIVIAWKGIVCCLRWNIGNFAVSRCSSVRFRLFWARLWMEGKLDFSSVLPLSRHFNSVVCFVSSHSNIAWERFKFEVWFYVIELKTQSSSGQVAHNVDLILNFRSNEERGWNTRSNSDSFFSSLESHEYPSRQRSSRWAMKKETENPINLFLEFQWSFGRNSEFQSWEFRWTKTNYRVE